MPGMLCQTGVAQKLSLCLSFFGSVTNQQSQSNLSDPLFKRVLLPSEICNCFTIYEKSFSGESNGMHSFEGLNSTVLRKNFFTSTSPSFDFSCMSASIGFELPKSRPGNKCREVMPT